MTGSVSVAAGVTLTIEPGVVVKADSQYRTLTVAGSLVAEGTGSSRITFTSSSDSAAGQWRCICFSLGAGTSSLKFVDVRYGGGGIGGDTNGMVEVRGGSVTIEDSTLTGSSVSGLRVNGGTSGGDASVTVRRTRIEGNGFYNGWNQGDGINVANAYVVVEDSASWANSDDGAEFWLTTGYAAGASKISGSSIWGNRDRGVYVFQDSGLEALAPDGNVAGKAGNAVYDNGSFGFGYSETWEQLTLARSSGSVDWSGTYWGAAAFAGCGLGSGRGHVPFGAPDPNPGAWLPVPRGAVSRYVDYTLQYPQDWCGNDDAVVNAPAYELPDLQFDAPPAIFGGVPLEQTFGCTPCDRGNGQLALAHDGENSFAYSSHPVNTATGSLTESATDLRLAGPGIPFAWTRNYNSRDTTSGGLGPGWAHPFEAKLTLVNATTGELEYRAGSGQRTHFQKLTGYSSGAATYAGKGFDGTLKRLANDSYELVTRDQRTFSFDTSGNLTQLKPRFLPATTLAYTSGKLSSITDSAGRTITLTYSSANPALIERVTLPDGRYVEYGYTSGRLSSVRDARGKSWALAYDGGGRLTSVQDPVGRYQLQNVLYDTQGRVTSEQDGSGNTTSYAYSSVAPYEITTMSVPGRGSWIYKHRGNMLFTVTDPLNRTTSYSYDGQGRRATEKDARGNLSRFEYDAYGNLLREVPPAPFGFTVTRTYNATNDLLTETDGRGNTTSYAYATLSDAATDYQVGQLKSITDRENGVTTFTYWTTTSSPTPATATVGLLKSATNQRGKTSAFAYDSAGNLSTLTSPLGLKTTFGYDGSGRLTSRRDPRGNMPSPPAGYLTQWSYDAVDHLSSLTDPLGNVTSSDYYDNELLWKQTRTDRGGTARVTTLEYDANNRLWKTTDPRGGVETRLYWPDGQLKSVESAAGRKTSYEYDDAGQLWKLVEPNGNVAGATAADYTWTYGYDAAGNQTSASHPDAGTSETAYDALNRPYQWDDPLDHRTSVSYDANGNITGRTNALGKSRSYGYDKLNRLTSTTDERGKTTGYSYFATGEIASSTSPLGNKTSYTIDSDGRTSTMVEARGNQSGATAADYTWAYQYDEAGNRTRITDPLGNYVQYAFDAVDNLTQVTDQRGNAVFYSYDVLNRLWKVTPPAAGATGTLSTEYSYDAAGNLASRTDPNNHTTSWSYDLDGLPTARTTPVGTWNYGYDANGNLKTLETPAGSSTGTSGDGTISYGYDRLGRPTSTDYSDATPDVTRGYDLAGRPTSGSDGAGSLSYTLDDADRITAITRSGGGAGLNGSFTYSYDFAGNITGRTYPDSSTVSQSFDDDGRLTTLSSGGATTTLGYDAAGNLTTTTLPSGNGHVETRSYDRAGRLTTVENAKSGTILSKHLWTLDAAGNPTKVKTTRGATDVYDVYEYDARNRLGTACYDLASTATSCSGASNAIGYVYDKVDNRTQELRAGSVGNTGTIDYAYNAADQLTSTTTGGVTTTYGYDANGNQASAGGRSFSYDLAGRLASTSSGGVTTSYGYDGDGRRSSSSSGGVELRYLWDSLAESGLAELALERDGSGNLVRRYLNGPSGALSQTTSGGSVWFHRNPLGSVTDVTDAGGVAQWRYEYEPYGASRAATDVSGSAPESRLRFGGQYLDPETALYHLRARQYDPATGRFGALDPVEPPLLEPYASAYGYVNGRPTVLVDPLGLFGIGFGDLGNALAGAADTVSLGLSTKGLRSLGVSVDTGSWAFKGGQLGGSVLVGGGATGVAVRFALNRGASRAARIAIGAASGSSGAILVGAARAAISGDHYGAQEAALDGAAGALGGALAGTFIRACPTEAFDEAAEDAVGLIYRTGARTDNALTDASGVSFRDSVSSSADRVQVFRRGDKIWAVDTSKLPPGSVVRDGVPPGHVTVSATPAQIREAVVNDPALRDLGLKRLDDGSYRLPK